MKILIPISLLLISGLLFFFVISPIYADVQGLREDVATYNLALSNSKELQATRDQLIEKYKNISQEDKDKLDHLLPNTVNNIKFILEIEQMANLHGMPIKDIKFEAQKQDDTKKSTVTAADPASSRPYGVFPIEFMTQGSYDTFVLFLKDMEHNLRLVDVKSVAFTVPTPPAKPTPGIDPNLFNFTLKVETFWLK